MLGISLQPYEAHIPFLLQFKVENMPCSLHRPLSMSYPCLQALHDPLHTHAMAVVSHQ